ncbi:hypothetical protein N7451_012529 [Penicillium sp. IBT 35674x]|nr:hypothetical protein N7451_012529 [Penicillium sp. IBT 35674x]
MHKRDSTSSKRGAAYNDAKFVSALSIDPGIISWAYNWGSTSNGDIPSGEEYVPMLWGSVDVDSWAAAVKTALADGSTHLMGFNEPDSSSQADMSYSNAATYYKQHLTIYADHAKLISPAVTSSTTTGKGLSWLSSFLSECTDCKISAVAVHWYGNTLAELKSFVTEASEMASDYGISEIWLTEFGLNNDESGITDLSVAAHFVEEAITWLDTNAAITRYAYFWCADGWMLTNGVTNSVGNAYLAISSNSDTADSAAFTTAVPFHNSRTSLISPGPAPESTHTVGPTSSMNPLLMASSPLETSCSYP